MVLDATVLLISLSAILITIIAVVETFTFRLY